MALIALANFRFGSVGYIQAWLGSAAFDLPPAWYLLSFWFRLAEYTFSWEERGYSPADLYLWILTLCRSIVFSLASVE